ncbi:acyl carrier protein [Hymenobacter sp. BT683]|uniref:Acyl carrier protein n=1 Tax=Hymenobacter jeongseonensis TaxID=2791027 RepID=A0ABS0ILU4_9BACT|nr:acyl carrier protein [Hymenobacter jeongseonensis]MBF9239343.1 acyl carrier protein [Hymenobacter jeongseonensis]
MVSSSPFPPSRLAVQSQILRVIRQRKALAGRLRLTSSLTQDLHFDPVDVVDVILALEQRFHLTIPDEVPLHVVGDLVQYVTAHLPSGAAPSAN